MSNEATPSFLLKLANSSFYYSSLANLLRSDSVFFLRGPIKSQYFKSALLIVIGVGKGSLA